MSAPPAAMVLAAGKGSRLGARGTRTPKALVPVNGRPLIERVLHQLYEAGVRRCVINLHHLGEQIRARLGSGGRFGLHINYSEETSLLDVGGGIRTALPLLGCRPFIVANADVCSTFDFGELVALAGRWDARLGHLVLGDNPEFRPQGDFVLADGLIRQRGGSTGLTYLGIAMYDPKLFAGIPAQTSYPMRPLWQQAIDAGLLSGQHYRANWLDVGTEQRVVQAQKLFGESDPD